MTLLSRITGRSKSETELEPQYVDDNARNDGTGVDVLVTGRLTAKPEERTDARGKPYTVAHVTVSTDGAPNLHIYVISHTPTVGPTLQTLEPGDTVTLSGPLVIRDNDGQTCIGIRARRMLSNFPTVTLAQHHQNKRKQHVR